MTKPGWASGEVEHVPLTMIHDRLGERLRVACPADVRVRSYTPGDEATWARIEAAAGAFASEAAALAHFAHEFAPHAERLPGRLLFIEDAAGPFGTTTAWEGALAGEPRGRIHWVGITPDYQGRGFSKPLLSAALDRLAHDSARAYLTTETTSYRGINLYLGFGFVPWIASEEDRRGWRIVEDKLGRSSL